MMTTIDFTQVAAQAGFAPGADGRLNLPATQATADALAVAALATLPAWKPGDAQLDVVLTGAGPVWGHLMIGHALHGRARSLTYSAPNVGSDGIQIFNHGRQA